MLAYSKEYHLKKKALWTSNSDKQQHWNGQLGDKIS